MSIDLPKHLGGHGNISNIDENLFVSLIDKYNIKNMLDVGCGTLGMVNLALQHGIDAYGVDGDFNLLYNEEIKNKERLSISDFTQSKWKSPIKFDLIWSVEVAEHIEEQYAKNYIETIADNIKNDGILVFTHANPGQGGYHHVNEQPIMYWEAKLAQLGLDIIEEEKAFDNQYTVYVFKKKGKYCD